MLLLKTTNNTGVISQIMVAAAVFRILLSVCIVEWGLRDPNENKR